LRRIAACGLLAVLSAPLGLLAADPIFSGPQPGERTTPFKVLEITGAGAGQERDPIVEDAGAATALVFVHGIERSLVPLLRVVDEYGAMRTNQLRTEIVFLAPDRLEGERRVKAAAGSLKLQARVGLSLDGAEGPGNYGLNKECLMTIVVATNNHVASNFALVQPGIADAPKVIDALAKASGDPQPPAIDRLTARQQGRRGPGQEGAMANPDPGNKAKDAFPGAVPTDATLQGLLRRFIRPSNDNAAVDAVLAEVITHIKGSPDLRQQAIDGWTRILHFGDRYGTAYARERGREFLDQLKREAR
jgi:hypothetical protein